MIHFLVAVIIFLLVAGVLWWCINQLEAALGIPAPIAVVIRVLFVLLCLLALLDYSGFLSGFHL